MSSPPVSGLEALCQNYFAHLLSPALSTLVRRLTDEEWEVRDAVAQAIVESGPCSVAELPGLIAAFTDENPGVRFCIAMALRKMGHKAKSAVPALKRLLKDEDEMPRTAAAAALARIDR